MNSRNLPSCAGGIAAGGSIGITLVRIVFPQPHVRFHYPIASMCTRSHTTAVLPTHSSIVSRCVGRLLHSWLNTKTRLVRLFVLGFIARGGSKLMVVVDPWLLVAGGSATHSGEAEAEAHLEAWLFKRKRAICCCCGHLSISLTIYCIFYTKY